MSTNFLLSKETPYCPGCGHQTATLSLANVLEKLNYDPLDVIVVSDIGCCGLIDPTLACHTVHGLHGRATALAAGISLAIEDKKKKVIAIQGDGGATIGIAHLMEAARRNINLTLIILNNMIYGMTGGQLSGLSHNKFRSEKLQFDENEEPFDITELSTKAGASYASRIIGKGDFSDKLAEAIKHDGFSVVEVLEVCPSYGVKKYSEIENYGYTEKKFITRREPYYLKRKIKKTLFDESEIVFPEFSSNIENKLKIIIAGSAGEGVQTSADLLAKASLYAGLHVTKKGDYPITVGSGFSIAEVILSKFPINFTGIHKPDVLIITSLDGLNMVRDKIGADMLVIIDKSISALVEKERIEFDFRLTAGKKGATIGAIAFWLIQSKIFSIDALIKAAGESKHGKKVIDSILKIRNSFSKELIY